MTEASPQAHAALTELLRGLFLDAPDLVAFVRASLGSEVAAVLPAAQVSLATYADELVATVQRQQCVPDLLARLAAAKPHAYDHICAAAAAYGIATPAPPGEGVAKAYKPHLPPLPPLGSRVPLRSRVRPKGASAQTVLVSGRLIKQPRLDNPASWLNARYMRVPFHAGLWADELARLEVWYMSDAPVGVIAVAGPGGIGKTRLMLELIARASAAGFTAGFVPPRARPAELAAVLADESRVLAVVDYAETRPSIVTWLAEAAALPDDGRRLRIVLVVRALADWWRFLRDHADSSLDALLARDEPLVLRQDDVGATTRVRVYTEAAMSFAGGAKRHRSRRRTSSALALRQAALPPHGRAGSSRGPDDAGGSAARGRPAGASDSSGSATSAGSTRTTTARCVRLRRRSTVRSRRWPSGAGRARQRARRRGCSRSRGWPSRCARVYCGGSSTCTRGQVTRRRWTGTSVAARAGPAGLGARGRGAARRGHAARLGRGGVRGGGRQPTLGRRCCCSGGSQAGCWQRYRRCRQRAGRQRSRRH
jgi:hypothetical protein